MSIVTLKTKERMNPKRENGSDGRFHRSGSGTKRKKQHRESICDFFMRYYYHLVFQKSKYKSVANGTPVYDRLKNMKSTYLLWLLLKLFFFPLSASITLVIFHFFCDKRKM